MPEPRRAQIIQNAYVVADLPRAMEHWSRTFGIGPFLLLEHIRPQWALHRGRPAQLDFSAAFVQSGYLNIELIQQHDDARSAFRDMYAADEQGFHHVALIAEDFEGEIAAYEAAGYPVATRFETAPGSGVAFVDTRPLLGHMVELYQNRSDILSLYRHVRDNAANWDGRSLLAPS